MACFVIFKKLLPARSLMSGYQASKSVALYPMAASSKTLSFAIETNNFLEESDN